MSRTMTSIPPAALRVALTAVALTVVLTGCGAETEPTGPEPTPTPSPTMSPSPSPTVDPHPSPTPTPPPEVVRRSTQRVTVAHLRRSIPRLFSGTTWTNGARNNPRVMFDVLSRTLGEADYVQATVANVSPNPIFAKFMDDMAGQVCAAAVAADAVATRVQDKVVAPYPDVAASLRYLRLKLHGVYVPDGSREGIEAEQALYDAIIADGGTVADAWTGVCVAMLTAPETMAY
jgi:hypothetical protein